MADPLELLETFPRSLSGGAPNPQDLRKRGDQRRNRHRAAGAAAVVAVVAAVVTPLAINGENDGSAPPPAALPDGGDIVSLAGEVPAGFPLMTGLPLWTGAAAASPEDAKGHELALTACGAHPAPPGRTVGNLQQVARQDAVTFQRTVTTFEDHAAAQQYAAEVRSFFENCATETSATGGTITHDVRIGTTPAEPAVTVTSYEEAQGSPQPGVQVDQLFVVGKAVLTAQVRDESAEMSSAQKLAEEQVSYAHPVVAALGHEWVSFKGPEGYGVFVENANQVATKLDGASAGFQSFVRQTVTELLGEEGCPDAAVGVSVQYIVDDRWALGGINQCGGYVALWGKSDAGWKELQGTQELWDCQDLKDNAIPEGIVGPCYDYSDEG